MKVQTSWQWKRFTTYAVITAISFGLSFAMPDVHHLVEMRLIAITVLAYTSVKHSPGQEPTIGSRRQIGIGAIVSLVSGVLTMAMAYLHDISKEFDEDHDYLYFRSIVWMVFTLQMCAAVNKAIDYYVLTRGAQDQYDGAMDPIMEMPTSLQ